MSVFACGLLAGPGVLFADELSGSLDSLNGDRVMDLLSTAVREQGTTVVLDTHEPRVAACADREAVIPGGQVRSLAAAATAGISGTTR